MARVTAPHKPLEYRPDIDGLRGVAVLAVVWFHSGLPGMPGGFTGVDVFFVISGYLITSIIHRDARERRFSFAYFYQRRFRRIAPALLAVTTATMAGGYVLLLPYELDQLSRSALATVAMASNVYFWRTTNYFAFADGISPLLHSWSLGVEEQFYLLFPAALVIAERFGRAKLVVAVLGIGSLFLCLIVTGPMPAASFYLLPTRGWELMIGAALSLGTVTVPQRASHVAGLTGIALVLASCVLLSASDPFPGWRALVPTIGTALIIGAGPNAASARLLSFRPIVYVGLVSYSFYLWHWPIFVFLREWRADLVLPTGWMVGGIAAAFLLSVLSHRWIERPARIRSTPFRIVLFPALAVAAAIVFAAVIGIATRGLPQRLPAKVDVIAANHDAFAPLARACSDIGFDEALKRCHIGPPGDPRLLLWGDSHAAAISEAVADGTRMPGLLISMGACPPVLGWPSGEHPAQCRDTNRRAMQLAVTDPQIAAVVLSWAPAEERGGHRFWEPLQAVVDRLRSAGKTVIVVAGIPDSGIDVPWASALNQRFGRPLPRFNCPKARLPLRGVTVVDVSASFCGEPAYKLFFDSNHPSRHAGLAIIAPAIRKAMKGGG